MSRRPTGDRRHGDGGPDTTTDDDGTRTSRRELLRTAGVALAAAVGTAGCLSNPWGPERQSTESGVGGDGTPAATSTTAEATTVTADDGTTESTTAQATTTDVPPEEREPDLVVEVAPDDFSFVPETFSVAAGDTVHWVWRSSGHNVRVRTKPSGSEWTGTPGSASDTYDEGYLHAHTFQESGQYEYFCAPHQTLGLEGSFAVE